MIKRSLAELSDGDDSSDEERLQRPLKKSGKLSHAKSTASERDQASVEDTHEEPWEENYLTMEIEGLHGDKIGPLLRASDIPLAKRLPKALKMMKSMGYNIDETAESGSKRTVGMVPVERKLDRIGIRTKPALSETEDVANVDDFRERINNEKNTERKLHLLKHMQKLAFTLTGDVDNFYSSSDPRDFNVLWRSYVIELLQNLTHKSLGNESEDDGHNHDHPEQSSNDVIPVDGELEMLQQLTIDEKIKKLNTFLRTELRYCFYCGNKYKDDADLFAHCPGFTEEDHQ
ncbi:Cmg1p [Kluyveromyces lactis]|uniref:KLLA0F20207p n=1 Tax=Kluyveromyces lactis (strain ATCC 8585 / CBS 2359 / DSM 70799 / NBRC 1267 / NRRL Y-1140 / WM37) TaxID=284590 RepID=Q6CJA2_KLULA|nr:uncharacterized protein KLLA0_F20207g [Kluyveromyces lactis]CAG98695.1 KLLA0F20207p [Kluyveromyces lactis]|eukprot:XP_455987.1 uncharacterized protein KLLA0_F20207g [Kluyveromyces lactis]